MPQTEWSIDGIDELRFVGKVEVYICLLSIRLLRILKASKLSTTLLRFWLHFSLFTNISANEAEPYIGGLSCGSPPSIFERIALSVSSQKSFDHSYTVHNIFSHEYHAKNEQQNDI